jgi:hypothetical protein
MPNCARRSQWSSVSKRNCHKEQPPDLVVWFLVCGFVDFIPQRGFWRRIEGWNAKFTYNFWRPVTAIRAGGANPELTPDAAWTSLATTPNHPEYPAAHGCVTGGSSRLVEEFFGTPRVHMVVDNTTTFSDGVHTHTFDFTEDWYEEVYWARILGGLHFHHSLEDGGTLGRRVASHVFQTQFRRQENN